MAAYALLGPPVYENWRATLAGAELLSVVECPLFTDTHIIGQEQDGYGPYQFLNPVKVGPDPFLRQPSIVVRAAWYLSYESPPMEQTDSTRYHGGAWTDEIAALVSLLLGIRVQAGDITRSFAPAGDPFGQPIGFRRQDQLPRPFTGRRHVVPTVPAQANLAGLAQLRILPRMTPAQAVALMLAARLYQDALYLVESEPALAWLMLVSAAETAANQWKTKRGSSLQRLTAERPALVKLLEEAGGTELATKVAREIAGAIGATQKFVDFLMAHLPSPPRAPTV